VGGSREVLPAAERGHGPAQLVEVVGAVVDPGVLEPHLVDGTVADHLRLRLDKEESLFGAVEMRPEVNEAGAEHPARARRLAPRGRIAVHTGEHPELRPDEAGVRPCRRAGSDLRAHGVRG
jgi:hypothetical protein